jgi:hypothetical protein
VNQIFLSATSENTREFGEWVGRAKNKVVHIVETRHRPVPLQHNLYMRNERFPILEGRNPFSDKEYQKALDFLNPKKKGGDKKDDNKGAKKAYVRPGGPPSWQNSGSKSQWQGLIAHLKSEDLLPTIAFSFSKKKCEEIAHFLGSTDLNSKAEASQVSRRAKRARELSELREGDGAARAKNRTSQREPTSMRDERSSVTRERAGARGARGSARERSEHKEGDGAARAKNRTREREPTPRHAQTSPASTAEGTPPFPPHPPSPPSLTPPPLSPGAHLR